MSRRHPLIQNFESHSVMLIASVTLGFAGSACAQNTPAPATPAGADVSAVFARADKNGDGKLSREEAATLPAIEADFDRIDGDKDGAISVAEFNQAMKM